LAKESENGLAPGYYQYLITGGTGQPSETPDMRIKDVNSLRAGPFQLTNPESMPYDAYAASPVHRFYQMWQQLSCSIDNATEENPAGCDASLFPWVEVTVGAGTNGLTQPSNFSTEYTATDTTTGEGSTSMAFYNVQQGDVPYFKKLADDYAMSDNYHQAVNGGTGANHIMLGHGDLNWFSDGNGNATIPPHNVTVDPGTANAGVVDEVENPNPAPNTNNWYLEDGYGGGSYGSASYGGGSYSECSDPTQPGVAGVIAYLQSLPKPVDPHCELPTEQLQSWLLRKWQQRLHRHFGLQHRVYNSSFFGAEYRRRPYRSQRFVEVLRRPVEQLRPRPVPTELRNKRCKCR
jgi:phospholipase C